MAKILAPNKQYNGISASVVFKEGVGETSDPHLIEWFKAKGYSVEDIPVKAEPPITEEPAPAVIDVVPKPKPAPKRSPTKTQRSGVKKKEE